MPLNEAFFYGTTYDLKRNPSPNLFSIFFSNAQKNLNCPNIKPIQTSSTWYIGNINIKRTGIIKYPKESFVIPSHVQNGLDNQADADPVIAKTIRIIMNWKFVSIPQRCLSLFIFIYNEYKCSEIISGVQNQKVFVCTCFGKKSCSCISNNLLHTHN